GDDQRSVDTTPRAARPRRAAQPRGEDSGAPRRATRRSAARAARGPPGRVIRRRLGRIGTAVGPIHRPCADRRDTLQLARGVQGPRSGATRPTGSDDDEPAHWRARAGDRGYAGRCGRTRGTGQACL
ncbi:MAG: hypothetical protein AVDCRST_MAG18-1540, partial [uncultured Thermomicrobiales bacterium]